MKDKRLFAILMKQRKRVLYKDVEAFAELLGIATEKTKGKYLVWNKNDCGMVGECSTLPELLDEVYSFLKLPN